MANPYEMGPMGAGVEKLVGALLGGDAVQEAARQKEAMRLTSESTANATLDKKITDAYLARDKRKAQQEYRAQLEKIMPPDLAAVASGAMIGGDANLEQAQKFGLRGQAATELSADPNFTKANALLGALAGKPIPGVTNVAGQNVTGIYGSEPVIENNDETLSKILANTERAGASRASAARQSAPRASSAGTYQRGGTKLEDAQAIVDELRADPEYDMTGIDAKVVADRIRTHGSFVPPKRVAGNVRVITPKGYTDTRTIVPPEKDSVPTINTPAEKGIYQELLDARAAIAAGKITREAAKKRLIANGLANIAGQL